MVTQRDTKLIALIVLHGLNGSFVNRDNSGFDYMSLYLWDREAPRSGESSPFSIENS